MAPLPVLAGQEGLDALAAADNVDFVVMAIVGMSALSSTLSAIKAKKTIGIANKEVLVAAGALVTDLAARNQVPLLPIDSEHSAIVQCLKGEQIANVRRIILTASGGPFRSFNKDQLHAVTPEDALKHPTWNMGPKITIIALP